MPKGRPKSTRDVVEWRIKLPAAMAGEAELILYDPMIGRAGYGRRSDLITLLLGMYLQERRNGAKNGK